MKRSHKHRSLQHKVLPRNPNRFEMWDEILQSTLQTIFDAGFRIWAECDFDKDPHQRYKVLAMANDLQRTTISADGYSVREAAQKIVKRMVTLELLAGFDNKRQAV